MHSAKSYLPLIRSRTLITVAGLLVSVFLFYVLTHKLNIEEVRATLMRAQWFPWIPLSLAIYALGLLGRGLRLRLLVSDETQLAVVTATNIIAVGHAANNVLPARLGEFVRAGMLSERTGLPYVQSLTYAFMERVFDGVAIVLLLLASALFIPLSASMLRIWQIATVTFGLGVAVLLAFAAVPQLFVNLTSSVTYRTVPRIHNRAVDFVSQVIAGLSLFNSYQRTSLVLVLSIVIWMLESLFFAFIMPCVGLAMSPAIAAAVMSITNLGILIPASPGYVGTYHFFSMNSVKALYLAKNHLAVSDATAFSYAVLVHLIFFSMTTVWGAVALASYAIKKGSSALLVLQAEPLNAIPDAPAEQPQLITKLVRRESSASIRSTFFWRQLCEALIGEEYTKLIDRDREVVLLTVTGFLVGQLSNLPRSLRLQLLMGIAAFRTYCFFLGPGPFASLSLTKRCTLVESWASGPAPLARKLFRPLRSLSLLAFFEDEQVKAAMHGVTAVAELEPGTQTR